MKPRLSPGFLVLLGVLLVAGGLSLASQWQQTMLLRGELDGLRDQERELKALRAANGRLRGQQVSATELAALRADHAAVARLRAEMEALTKHAPAVGR
jgi:hypothetical protein